MKPHAFVENIGLLFLAMLKLAIQLANSAGYGYFVDELYYLALARHLDFGYVDVPPLVPLLMAISNRVLGTSLFALHIFPAIAGAAMVFFAGLLAREMGGGRFAQWLTAMAVIFAPIWLVLNSWFAYDPFDQLATVVLMYVSVRIINAPSPRLWIIFGSLAGIGILIKLTMLITCAAFGLAFLLSAQRKSLVTRWPWLAGGVAILICLPFVRWQYAHGWPLLTYWQHYAQFRPHPSLAAFAGGFVLALHPVAFPLWSAGLVFLGFHPQGKRYRLLAFVYIILLGLFAGVMRTEYRMLVSACFPLLAAGAIWLEGTLAHAGRRLFQRGYAAVLLVSGMLLIPHTFPPVPADQPVNIMPAENPLPDHVTLRVGWPEMTAQVAEIYHHLPECAYGRCAIYASYYGEAAAIDFFGDAYDLPDAISNHLTYHIWGPGEQGNDVVIAFGKRFSTHGIPEGTIPLAKICAEVNLAGTIPGQPASIAYEKDLPIYVCKRPHPGLQEIWKALEFYY